MKKIYVHIKLLVSGFLKTHQIKSLNINYVKIIITTKILHKSIYQISGNILKVPLNFIYSQNHPAKFGYSQKVPLISNSLLFSPYVIKVVDVNVFRPRPDRPVRPC